MNSESMYAVPGHPMLSNNIASCAGVSEIFHSVAEGQTNQTISNRFRNMLAP